MAHNSPLNLLLGGYLNQDWPNEYPTYEAAVDDFILREPTAAVGLASEIYLLLSSQRTEDELREAVRRLGGAYTADWDGGTYQTWLGDVAFRVARAIGEEPHDWDKS